MTVGQENLDKEGVLPAFIVRVQDDKVSERKFKLNGPIVRRVVAPGERLVRAVTRRAKRRRR